MTKARNTFLLQDLSGFQYNELAKKLVMLREKRGKWIKERTPLKERLKFLNQRIEDLTVQIEFVQDEFKERGLKPR